MRKFAILALAVAVAGCSQTTGSGGPKAQTKIAPPSAKETRTAPSLVKEAHASAQPVRCADAANEAAKAQTNAAMLGGALSMVGGLGGLGGRGGMVAAQAASVGGSVVQSQASAKSQAALNAECR
jgi:hypothetical protein